VRAFRIAYDGRPFHGYQRQPSVPTVEGTLFEALGALDVSDPAGDDTRDPPPGYAAAGRTDAGVSALAQTVGFEAPDWCSPAALNSELPASVRAWAAADVPADFHATHDAVSRTYVYYLYAPATATDSECGSETATGTDSEPVGRAGPGGSVDDERARRAAAALAGRNDYHNLTPDDEGTVRDLAIDLERDGPFLVVTVEAGGFARELVRRLVSVIRAVGAGESDLAHVDRLLDPTPVDGPDGVPPAPAPPLVLVDVSYPEVAFSADAAAVASARAAFGDRRREARVAARVHDRILAGVE
jgi:tRNA pseudouridine38-40 synthase